MTVELRRLGPDDATVLERVAEDVFDGPVVLALGREFLDDPRHHLIVALDDGVIIGIFAS